MEGAHIEPWMDGMMKVYDVDTGGPAAPMMGAPGAKDSHIKQLPSYTYSMHIGTTSR